MRYGHFDDEAREYVITTPHTPYPWINYLGSEEFFSLLSHTGGGYSFYRDAKMRRLTRYRYNTIPTDEGGRYFYVHDRGAGDVWTPGWAPVKADLDHFEARHGLGYSRITGERDGLKVDTLFFVPLGETAEVQQVTLTNTSDAPKSVGLFSFVEFCLWNAQDDQTNYQRTLSLAEVEVELDGPHGSAIYHKTEYRERRDHYAVYAVNTRASGFDTDRDSFVGPWNGLGEAAVPRAGTSTDSVASGWHPIGSHQVDVTLAPGESRSLTYVLGYVENPHDEKWAPADEAADITALQIVNKDRAHALLSRFATTEQTESAFEALRAHWTGLLSTYSVTSTDEKLDRMVNIWNQYQCMVTFTMSRSASYFETGIGRGMGFRDSNQDLLGFVHLVPERARARILDIASTQLPDGSAYHQYQPLTKRGNNDIGSGFNDDPLWLILGVAAYLKETGDTAILDEPVPFDNQPSSEVPLFEHLTRSFEFTVHNQGPHGLPLIGRADWNDCLNLNCFSTEPGESFQTTENRAGGVAESVFIATMFVHIGPEYAELAERRGLTEVAADARAAVERMRTAVLTHGWDGEWFLRAYDFSGNPVGTDATAEGKIWIEPQGFAVMAGIGVDSADPTTPESAASRAIRALDATRGRLATPHGMVLQSPAYTSYRIELGEVSTYPPGYKENGGILCHNNPWVIIGETVVGRGARVRLLPADHPGISRGDLRRAPAGAVRVRADDRRQGGRPARRGQELLADRHRGVGLRRRLSVPAGRAAGVRRPRDRPADRARRPGVHRHPGRARRAVRDRRDELRPARRPGPAGRRRLGGRRHHCALRPRGQHRARRGDALTSALTDN